ncbi:MAG: ribosome biogenesis factor YjgA [Methylicorpusculum sp.]|uniref:ribosome biogenesis factor YjgA n=1 Tax=Methylicorpusculum sp. TaxID=2713644 RepID=UPI00271AD3BD|nr:ribosome biogenesis factor YjgA [Methylicorpusculum sp.]MDO8938821.1 ribosome biogenesis factor YjgA [Methylicorpusculum sp.]MDO9240130.1 ribosome biogenesis factor YjgA [Methylicorpusculum sp.]MDP2203269.1 ribosome biogenesis factor YjgA [Methylicorpusculum sp.]
MINDYEEDYLEEDDDEYIEYAVRPNKTQIKREIAALFELGEELAELSNAQLNQLDLTDELKAAVVLAAGMPPKGARKRQLKFISSLLRNVDSEAILEKLARMKTQSAHAVREHHKVEKWRDRLIAEGNDALTELLDDYAQADHQHLRHLVRSAQKEAELAKPPKSSRQLYHYLKELFETDSATDNDDQPID